MLADMGEYIVGAYLKLEMGCDIVDYNVRVPGGGLEGLNELDVVGYDHSQERAVLCEVATHIRGLNYGSYGETTKRVQAKFERQKAYAASRLARFKDIKFQLWSPYVPKGALTEALEAIDGLELIINGVYRQRIEQLSLRAKSEKHETGNPFFRALQIIAAVREA